MKKPPIVIKTYTSLVKNPAVPKQELKVRVVRYNNTNYPLLDIREFITDGISLTGEPFTGFTNKGTAIRLAQVQHLYKMLPNIIRTMQRMEPKEITNVNVEQNKDTTQENQAAMPPTDGTQEVGETSIDPSRAGEV